MKHITSFFLLFILTLALTAQSQVEQLSWMKGSWEGEKWGGTVDEYWSSPSGNSVIGMFRLVDGKGVQFTEHWMISEFDGKLALRLRHFNPDFTAWEEKDEYLEFAFVEMGKNFIKFKGLSYELAEENEMKITLDMKRGDKVEKEIFILKKK